MTDTEMQRLAALVADRVFNLPPAADHFGLPVYAQSANRWQELFSILLANQAQWQLFARAIDEAAANLLKENYQPLTK